MRSPSIKRLLAAFKDLTPEKAKLIKKLTAACDHGIAGTTNLRKLIEDHCPKTQAHVRWCHSDPFASREWRTTMCLEAIDETLGTYGVEPLGPVDMRDGPPYEYCNTGDTYATTLIYSRVDGADNLFIGCWGDIAERHSSW